MISSATFLTRHPTTISGTAPVTTGAVSDRHTQSAATSCDGRVPVTVKLLAVCEAIGPVNSTSKPGLFWTRSTTVELLNPAGIVPVKFTVKLPLPAEALVICTHEVLATSVEGRFG